MSAPAPTRLRLPVPLATPTLALGDGTTWAYGHGSDAVVFTPFPEPFDIEDVTTQFAETAARMDEARRGGPAPQQCVHDLHPDHPSSRVAAGGSFARLAVQHHHAHFAAAFVDARVHGPALGLILDGPAHGGDGTVWGGEILVGDPSLVWRAAHLVAVPTPGDVLAESWRMALSYLFVAGEPFADLHPDAERAAAQTSRAPRTSSAALLFDAVAAIVGVASREALCETAQRADADGLYPFELRGDELDVIPMIRAIARDVRRHADRAAIARRFHSTVIEMFSRACEQLARGEGLRDVVLGGSLFDNAILAAEIPARLRELGLVAHAHRQLAAHDDCVAFGQLAVAAATGAIELKPNASAIRD